MTQLASLGDKFDKIRSSITNLFLLYKFGDLSVHYIPIMYTYRIVSSNSTINQMEFFQYFSVWIFGFKLIGRKISWSCWSSNANIGQQCVLARVVLCLHTMINERLIKAKAGKSMAEEINKSERVYINTQYTFFKDLSRETPFTQVNSLTLAMPCWLGPT